MNLVTGATGLLGSHIAEKLVQDGRPVRALVRPSSDTRFLASLGVQLAVGDITSPQTLPRALEGVDSVYHAAAKVGDWGPWEEFERVTISGTRSLLQAAKAARVRRFVHISSISVYGYPKDSSGTPIDERAPIGQNLFRWSYYTRAKVAAERLVRRAHVDDGLGVTIIRPSWLYGPRDRVTLERLVALFRNGKARILGCGDNKLNVVYAGNVAEGAILAADNERAVGEVYNLSNDGEITQSAYLGCLAEALGVPPPSRHVPFGLAYRVAFLLECFGHLFHTKKPPMVSRYAVWLMGRTCYFSTKKAREQLGWKSSVSYEEGIHKTIKWYVDTHPDGA